VLECRLVPSNVVVTVNTAVDDPSDPTAGVVTLRDAIATVNNDGADDPQNPDVIRFAVPGAPVISLAANLPAITNPVFIDGSTQAGVTVDGRASAGANGHQGFAILVVSSTAAEKGVTFTNGPLTVNAGGNLSVAGDFNLGDAAGHTTVVQNYGAVSVSGNVVGGDNVGLNNYSGATFQVGGAYTAGEDGYVYNYGTAAFSAVGDLTLGDFGSLSNGLSSTDQATCTVGGNFSIGKNGLVNNYGSSTLQAGGNFTLGDDGSLNNGADFTSTDAATFSVGGSFSIGFNGFAYNDGISSISVGGDFSLGDFGYFYNGVSSSDASSLTVGGSFSIGAGACYVYNYGTSTIHVGDNFTLGDDGFVYNGVSSFDAATFTVGGNFSLGVSGGNSTFVYNSGASVFHVAGDFTLHGDFSFASNGLSSGDTAVLTVGGNIGMDANGTFFNYGTTDVTGSFTMGASSYFLDYGALSVSGAFDAGSGSSVSDDIVGGAFNAEPGSSVTTDAAPWKVLAGGQVNVGAGAVFDVASGGSLLDGGVFTAESGSSVAVNSATFEVLAGGQLAVNAGASFDVSSGSTLSVDGGIVVGVRVTNGGSGYSSPPAVTFSGTGTGAVGVGTIVGGVTSVAVTTGGSGYVAAKVLLFGDGSGATAVASVTNHVVTSITITNPGSGYTKPPFVYIYDASGGGFGAAGAATITGSVTSVTITSPGSGYTSPPSVSFVGSGTGAAGTAVINTTRHGLVTVQGNLTVEGAVVSSKLSALVVDQNGHLTTGAGGQLNIQGTLLVWNNPADTYYGTPLSSTQLDAVASTMVNGSFVTLPGKFTYTPQSGTLLPVGQNYALSVAFTPNDTTDYASASAQAFLNVQPLTPTITLDPVNFVYGTALADTQLTTGVATAVVNNQVVSVSGTFSYTSAGGAVLNAGNGQSEAVTFTPNDSVDFAKAYGTVIVNVAKADQTITVTQAAPGDAVYGASFVVAATSSAGLPVSIAASGAGAVTSGGLGSAAVQMTSGSGIAAVTFTQAGTSNYNPATVVEEDVTAHKADQTIVVTQAAPGSAVYGSSFVVSATSTSGLPVSIAAGGAGSGGGSGSVSITMTSGTGTATVTISQAGDDNYNAATTIVEDVTAQKADQTITVTQAAPAAAVYGSSFGVSATSTSGLPVSIVVGGVGAGGGGDSASITMTSGTGTATVTISQAGDGNYNAATTIVENVVAEKANQTILVSQAAPGSAVYGATFSVAATSTSGLLVGIQASGVASGGGAGSASITITSGTGTAAVTFSQDGDSNYNAATTVVENVTAQKANQTILVTQAAPGSAVYGSTFSIAATSTGGGPVSILAGGVASGSGSGSASVTMTSGTGTASVTFSQPGDGNYNAATTIVENVTAQKANQAITVTQAPPAGAVQGASFVVAAVASSGLTVGITASGAASGSGAGSATITLTGASGVGVITFSQSGNANYASASTAVSVQVIAPGVYVVGSELWYVGASGTGGKANNQVQINPAGASSTGNSGVVINGVTYNQAFTAIRVFDGNGNDNIQINKSLTIDTFITEGDGNDTISVGNGNNTITLGNGNNNVVVGNGNNVIVTGNGHDTIQAGNGNNLIVAGLGQHNVQAGNGCNMLIDGSVQLTQTGDSLRQVLNDWTLYGASAANVASIRSRLAVTYNSSHSNSLKAGSGLDWFWCTFAKDSINRKATDLVN
jgi:hypothetical protein